MKPSPTLMPVLAAAFFLLQGVSHSAVLVDSIGGSPGTSDGALDEIGKAVAFTTGADLYQIDNVQLTIRRAASSTVEPVLTAAIYTSTTSGGNIRPTNTQVVSFIIPTINPTGTATLYTFNPATPGVTLDANTTYFFVIYNTANAGGLSWRYSTGGASTGGGYTIPADTSTVAGNQVGWYPNDWESDSNPAAWTGTSGVYNDLIINGTLVPEPSSAVLLSAFAALGLTCRRR